MNQNDFNVSNESIIRNAIQEMILNNELKSGDKLPSENALADEYKVKRLHIVNHVPSAIHVSFIREDVVPDIDQETDQLASVFNYCRNNGITNLKSTDTQIHTAFPTLAEQRNLECHELVPLIVYESQTVDEDTNNIIEQTRILYRSDLFKHSLGSVN